MLRACVGAIGEQIIYALIWLFGRRLETASFPWLAGPLGGQHIGDRPYEETAESEGLTLARGAQGGLIPDFGVLAGEGFDAERVHPKIRHFYENTHAYRFDTWATTYFPARLALWLMVQTISRRVNQLNFPIDGLEMAHGMKSEIILLREPDGAIRYTGWFRRMAKTERVVFTGFYLTSTLPIDGGRFVKVIFPMPDGNATVFLRPKNDDGSGFRLESIGRTFGDAGFYRVQRAGDRRRVWRVGSLHETFDLSVDEDGRVRCQHEVRFLGFRVLTLHYRIEPV